MASSQCEARTKPGASEQRAMRDRVVVREWIHGIRLVGCPHDPSDCGDMSLPV